MRNRAIVAAVGVSCLLAGVSAGGEGLVTVRFGEQDTCTVRNVTTGQGNRVRFDLSSLDKATRVVRAELRYWVSPPSKAGRIYDFSAYGNEAFDGFKVWAVPTPGPGEAAARGKPLDVRFPFNRARYGLMAFDVTPAAQGWVKDPDRNKGLVANVALPGAASEPAWMRPYLQVTYAGPNPNRPKQPTALKAACRGGQVFLTWRQGPHAGAFFDSTCRIYRHTAPITGKNLDQAERIGQVHRLSQLNHRRTLVTLTKRYGCRGHYAAAGVALPKRFNFVVAGDWAAGKDWIADFKALREDKARYGRGGTILHQGPQLSDETGLFVRTVTKAGTAHYAATAVVNGNENRADFGRGNTVGVQATPGEPQPVLQAVFNTRKNHHGHYYQFREYVLWPDERFHNVAGVPLCFLVVLSADPRNTPQVGLEGGSEKLDKRTFSGWGHLSVMLNGYSSHYWHNLPRIGMKLDTNYIPPTPQAPFPPNAAVNVRWAGYDAFYYGSAARPAGAGKDRGWRQGFIEPYGYVDTFNTTADARRAIVQPYLQRLARWMVTWANAHLPFNPKRWTIGEETGPLAIAMHSGDLFGAADVSQCYDWSAPRAVGVRRAEQRPDGVGGWQFLAGLRRWKLKNDLGFNVWDYNSVEWYAAKFPRGPWPVMTHLQSTNYAGGEWWKTYNLPGFYLAFPAHKRYVDAWWIHCGDCPRGNLLHVELDEPYPAFARCNISDDITQAPQKVRRGSLFGYISWSRRNAPLGPSPRRRQPALKQPAPKLKADLVDTPERFEMAFRINRQTTHVNYSRQAGPTRANYGMTDITLRRMQNFKLAPGQHCVFQNCKVSSGRVLQSMLLTADAHGLVTVPGFYIDRDPLGNKLILTHGEMARSLFVGGKVGELSYDEYVRKCRNPELHLTVRGPRTAFVTEEIGLGQTYKGGDEWGGQMSEAFQFARGGTYKLSVRAKARFGLGWPMMSARVGAWRGAPRVVDHKDWHEYTWYGIPVAEGLHDVVLQCVNGYYYRRGLAGNAIRSRKTYIQAITFERADGPTAGKPAEIRILPRNVEVPAGMPIQMIATVLDGAGRRIGDARVKWSASGGQVTGAGEQVVLQADKGEYVISAEAGGVTETAPIRVTDRFWEDFDTGSLRGWEAIDLGKKPARWEGLWGGNTPPLQSLRQGEPAAGSVLVWGPGREWTDYAASADVVYPAGRTALPGGGAVGLAVRASGDAHCRFELDRAAGKARLVRRAAGGEKVLAESATVPPRADLDPFTNAISRAYHTPEAKKAGKNPLKGWKVDHIRIECTGRTCTVSLNGRDVFGKALTGDLPPKGSVGLFAAGSFYFDNVEVRPGK